MIRVTIELLPKGDAKRATVIGTAELTNIKPTVHTYLLTGLPERTEPVSGAVYGHQPEDPAWLLVSRMLANVFHPVLRGHVCSVCRAPDGINGQEGVVVVGTDGVCGFCRGGGVG